MTAAYDKLIDLPRLELFLQNLESQGGGGSAGMVLFDTITHLPNADGFQDLPISGIAPGHTCRFEFCMYSSPGHVASDTDPMIVDITTCVPGSGSNITRFRMYPQFGSGMTGAEVFVEGTSTEAYVYANKADMTNTYLYLRRVVALD